MVNKKIYEKPETPMLEYAKGKSDKLINNKIIVTPCIYRVLLDLSKKVSPKYMKEISADFQLCLNF